MVKAQEGCTHVTVGKSRWSEQPEFVVVTHWRSVDALQAFAGPDWQNAVIAPEEEHMCWPRSSAITTKRSTRAEPAKNGGVALGALLAPAGTRSRRARHSSPCPPGASCPACPRPGWRSAGSDHPATERRPAGARRARTIPSGQAPVSRERAGVRASVRRMLGMDEGQASRTTPPLLPQIAHWGSADAGAGGTRRANHP